MVNGYASQERNPFRMISTLERPRPAAVRLGFRARPFELVGSALLRYGLVFFLAGTGYGVYRYRQEMRKPIDEEPVGAHSEL